MAGYEIFFRESVWKELKKKVPRPRADLKKSFPGLSSLETIPGLWIAKNSQARNYTESVKEIIGLYIRYRITVRKNRNRQNLHFITVPWSASRTEFAACRNVELINVLMYVMAIGNFAYYLVRTTSVGSSGYKQSRQTEQE